MTDFTDMLSKAKEMQKKMKEAQDAIKNIEVVGESGGNLVKVVLSGDYELKSIVVSDEAKKEDREILLEHKHGLLKDCKFYKKISLIYILQMNKWFIYLFYLLISISKLSLNYMYKYVCI